MTASPSLAAHFQSILDVIADEAPTSAINESDPILACGHFETVLSNIILPRRITLRADSGDRLSVIARNRRIVAIVEVHPTSLWTGDGEPKQAECQPDFETFGMPLAKVVSSLVSGGEFHIDQHFVTDTLPDVGLSGYPASLLSGHLTQVNDQEQSGFVTSFFDACSSHPRTLFGSKSATEIPEASGVTDDWLTAQAVEYANAVAGRGSDLRFIERDGAAPIAMACVWMNGLGSIAATDDPEKFDELKRQLTALQTSPQSIAAD